MARAAHALVKSRLGRGVTFLVALLVGGFFSLMWLTNALLGSGGLGWLIAQSTDDVRLELGHAYSLWPGRVEFRDLHLEIHDSSVHFDLRIPRGDVQVDLPALVQRRFEGRELTASGAVLRVRSAPPYRSKSREARLPNLSAPKPATGTSRASDLWGVAVGIEDLRLEEIWYDDVHLRGNTSVRGAFDLQPLDYLSVSATHVELSEADVWLGDSRLLSALDAKLQVDVPRTSVAGAAGPRLLEQAVAKSELSARVERLDPLSAYLPSEWGLVGGEGRLKMDVGLRNLELDQDSRLDYRSPELELHREDLRVVGTSDLLIEQREHGFARWTLSQVDILRVSGAKAAPRALGSIDRVKLMLAAEGPLHRLGVERGELDVDRLAVDDLGVLRAALREPPKVLRGSLRGSVHAQYAGARLEAQSELTATRLRIGSDNLDLRTDAWFSARASASAPFRELDFSKLSLDLKRASVRRGARRSGSFDAALRTTGYQLQLQSLEGSGPVRVELSDTRPLEQAADVDAPDLAKGLFGLEGLELVLETEVSKQRQDVRIVRGQSGSARVDGRLLRRGDDTRLVLLVSRGVLSVGIAAWPGDSSIVPLAGDDWLKEQLGRI